MRIKALVSFSGALSMRIGEEREYDNEVILSDLLQAGYIDEIKPEKTKKAEKPEKEVISNESKRSTVTKRSRVSKK